MDINKYIVEGKVKRTRIVYDISSGELSKSDIKELVENPVIQSSFFGGEFRGKKPKEQWDKDYLECILCAAVGESFNEEYLLYLDEVARYVNQNQKKSAPKFKMWIVVAIAAIIAVIAGLVALK